MKKDITFGRAVQRIDEILDILENRHPALEETFALTEEAGELLEFCYKKLDGFELLVTKVNDKLAAFKTPQEEENNEN